MKASEIELSKAQTRTCPRFAHSLCFFGIGPPQRSNPKLLLSGEGVFKKLSVDVGRHMRSVVALLGGSWAALLSLSPSWDHRYSLVVGTPYLVGKTLTNCR